MKRMSSIWLVIMLLSFSLMAAEEFTDESGLAWETNLDDAIAQAESSGKSVLVNFTGSDWCGWCIKLREEVFSKEAFHKYAKDNIVLVFLDFPKKKKLDPAVEAENRSIMEMYGIQGFPTILLLNSKGRLIGRTGYQEGGPEAYINHLKSFMKK